MKAADLCAEVVPFMRQALKASPKPKTVEALREAALALMRAPESTSKYKGLYFGERAQAFGVLDRMAACILAKKGYADLHPDEAAMLPAEELAALEQALAG